MVVSQRVVGVDAAKTYYGRYARVAETLSPSAREASSSFRAPADSPDWPSPPRSSPCLALSRLPGAVACQTEWIDPSEVHFCDRSLSPNAIKKSRDGMMAVIL